MNGFSNIIICVLLFAVSFDVAGQIQDNDGFVGPKGWYRALIENVDPNGIEGEYTIFCSYIFERGTLERGNINIVIKKVPNSIPTKFMIAEVSPIQNNLDKLEATGVVFYIDVVIDGRRDIIREVDIKSQLFGGNLIDSEIAIQYTYNGISIIMPSKGIIMYAKKVYPISN